MLAPVAEIVEVIPGQTVKSGDVKIVGVLDTTTDTVVEPTQPPALLPFMVYI